MGTDKATLLVEGVAMARRVADALLAAGCSRVIAIGGDVESLGRLGLEVVADEYPGEGPLGGILTATSVASPAVVVACDLPHLRAATVTRLIDALGSYDAAVARTYRIEPLCAVWSARAASVLRQRHAEGERAVHRAIEDLDVRWVTVDAVDLRNVNTPRDVEPDDAKDRG
jgi:molybdopterin-guanine dinucleotide biosynthesis protein A